MRAAEPLEPEAPRPTGKQLQFDSDDSVTLATDSATQADLPS